MRFSACALLSLAIVTPLGAQTDSLELVGVHPWAAAQPTARGRAIVSLVAWKGRLLTGYGDYGANTGPITLAWLDPSTGRFDSAWSANTEAVENIRIIDGRIYATSTDRRSYSVPGDFAVLDTNGTWSNRNCGSTTHAYDIVRLAGRDLWIVGSQDVYAAVFRSTDDGATWNRALRDSVVTPDSTDFARFYFAGVLAGRLYVQARDYVGPMHPRSRVFDGTAWSDGPDLFPGFSNSLGWRPETFAGKLLYRSWEPRVTSRLMSFDGSSARWLDSIRVRDVVVGDGFCHVIADSAGTLTIRRTTDLTSWTTVGHIPPESTALAYMEGTYYVGTSDSRIIRLVPPSSAVRTSDELRLPMNLR